MLARIEQVRELCFERVLKSIWKSKKINNLLYCSIVKDRNLYGILLYWLHTSSFNFHLKKTLYYTSLHNFKNFSSISETFFCNFLFPWNEFIFQILFIFFTVFSIVISFTILVVFQCCIKSSLCQKQEKKTYIIIINDFIINFQK